MVHGISSEEKKKDSGELPGWGPGADFFFGAKKGQKRVAMRSWAGEGAPKPRR